MMWLFICLSVVHTSYGASHWTRWSQLGSCSVTCGPGEIWQKRTCIGEAPNPICPGAQQRISRCQMLACPVNECNCGCHIDKEKGTIRSMSPSPKSLDCTWTIKVKAGNRIRLTVDNFLVKYGELRVIGPSKIYRILNKRKEDRVTVPFSVLTKGNQLNVSFYYNKVLPPGDHVKLKASFESIELPSKEVERKRKQEDTRLNIPTVVGIGACVFIIVLVTCLIVYRRAFNHGKSKGNNETEDEADNCASSSSTSIKHGGVDMFWEREAHMQNKKQTNSDRHMSHSGSESDHQRLLTTGSNILPPNMRMNPTPVPMYVNADGSVGCNTQLNGPMGYAPQYSNPPSYILIPQTANIMKDTQLNYSPRKKSMPNVYDTTK